VDRATDPKIKDAVLLEATHCIFGASAFGYLPQDEEFSHKSIIEMARGSGDGGK